MTETKSTCPYCGVGCGVIIESEPRGLGDQITGVRGDPDHPANFGRLCTKGSTLHLTASAPVTLATRLLKPQHRLVRGSAPQALGWEAAIGLAADRFAEAILKHGPDSVGFYLSGQLLTEDYYVFNKLAKGLIGTNNLDTNSRLCMSSAVAGYKLTLGVDAPPCSYEDLALADTVFMTGSNTAWAHPILFRRLEDAKRASPGQRWIVVDPRRTETADSADLFLQIQPGTDVALYHGMLHLMLWEGWTDAAYMAAHTNGFDALREAVRIWTPKETARTCGITEADLLQATRWFANVDSVAGRPSGERGATLSLYCQGLNQSAAGTDKNAALINLHLATAQIGRPGAGPFSLTGQPNAMGGREVGGLANLLSAHRDLANPAHRAEVAAAWGLQEVPATPGKSAIELFQAAADGEIQALWIACTNPAQSMPDQATVRRALERCPFVVVQEAFATTATCAYADLLLPATTWGEKEGTVTNSERRISRVRAAVPAAGEARHDWAIGTAFAQALETRLAEPLAQRRRAGPSAATSALPTLFPYAAPESVWNEHRDLTRGRDLDITGLSYAQLEADGPQQWPFPAGASHGQARLYEDGRFATLDGKARFHAATFRPVAEPCDARYPFALTTGRLRDQWHGMSRTGTLGRLFGHVAEPCIEVHPTDLARRQWVDGELVRVVSRRGEIVLPVQASTTVAPTQAHIAMHWGSEMLSGHDAQGRPLHGVNALTLPTFCPGSKQPELKHAAVRIEKAGLPWHMVGLAWLPQAEALAAREALKALMPSFGFALCVPFGREPHAHGLAGLLWRAAATEPASAVVIEHIESLLGLDAEQVLRYQDPRRGQRRAVRMVRDGEPSADTRLRGVLMCGDTRAEAWIKTLLQDELPAQAYGRSLLAPGANAPAEWAPRSQQVCTCFNVDEAGITGALAGCSGSVDDRLGQLQASLKCGTNCGSCLPAVRQLVKASIQAA